MKYVVQVLLYKFIFTELQFKTVSDDVTAFYIVCNHCNSLRVENDRPMSGQKCAQCAVFVSQTQQLSMYVPLIFKHTLSQVIHKISNLSYNQVFCKPT